MSTTLAPNRPIGVTPGGEFQIYRPDPVAAAEEEPAKYWKGSELEFITSSNNIASEPLQPSLEKLLQHI